MAGKNILVITGSPRVDGNSDRLADAFIDGALVGENNVVRFDAGRMNIGGCKACDTCFTKGNACSFTDGFNTIAPEIEKSDVIVVVIDGNQGVIEQDKHVAGYAHEAGKGVILVVNKWDLVEKDEKTMQKKEKELRSQFKYLDYARIIFLSAKTHQRVQQLFPLIQESFENSHKRVQTSVLNDVLVDAQAINPTTTFNGGRLKIFYANQVSICPPTFVLFVNDPQYMHFSYKRYLENRLRDSFGFEGTPIHIICRKRD